MARSSRFERLDFLGTRCFSCLSILVWNPPQQKGKRALLEDLDGVPFVQHHGTMQSNTLT